MTDLAVLRKHNAERWTSAKLTRGSEFDPVARRLCAAKSRYQAVEAKTGVPWFFIAVTHQRESSQNWNRSLAQGDPWDEVSTHVPKGRGPFPSWEAAAIDALVNCAPHAASNKDWSVGGTLTMLEQYNGLGYASKGLPSPYVWSGTDQYIKGKYIADGVFDASVVDRQLGCAGLILAMMKIDPSIRFGDPAQPPPDVPKLVPAPTPPPKAPAVKNTAQGATWITAIAAALQSHKVEVAIGIVVVAVVVSLAIHFLWPKKKV